MAAERTRERLLSLLLGVVSLAAFLAIAELGLRGAGFGGAHLLFVEVPDAPTQLQANPDVLRRYFPTRAPSVGPEPIPFAREKPADGLRIVVQGGSTAAGFPYGRFGGLAGMLGDRLETSFPEREIEVITTAMAAVNSYTLLDFADEIAAVAPDAVLVYAGHNEYMGVLGVGSGLTASRSRPATLIYLSLRPFRTHQLLQTLVSASRDLASGSEPPAHSRPGTLMRRAASGGEIPYGSEAYRAGIRQLEENLGTLLDTYRDAGIPVFLATLVSNEKDQPPFAGDQGDPDGADAWYARGRRALEDGLVDEARAAFREARDRDALRFRAPSAFDEAIRRAAADHGAILVDVARRFVEASPQGIPGAELLLEHLHPNAEGYFLIADAFHDALRAHGLLGDGAPAQSREDARRDVPITRVDHLLAAQAVRELVNDFPFRETRREIPFPEPRNAFERLARDLHAGEITWLEAMEGQLQLHRDAGRLREAALVARMAAQAYPAERATNFTAGALHLQIGELALARRYLARSLQAAPSDVPALRAIARLERIEDDARERSPGPRRTSLLLH